MPREKAISEEEFDEIDSTKAVLRQVVEFVREKRRTRTRVVAKDVMMMLVEGGHIAYNEFDSKDTMACLRSVQDYLFSRGFKRGHKKGQGQYGLTKEVVLARDKYIKCISRSFELTPHRPVVYLDESYIHHNYARHNDSLYFPDDADDKAPKPKHKGQRLCFIAAILDDGPTSSKLMAKRVFRGGRRETKDYHGMFDRAYFVNWFKELMDELDLLGKAGALIVMDNASYHKTLPSDTPKGTWKKQDLLAACERFGIVASTNEFKTVVWSKVQAYVKANVVPEVVAMAQARGHEVAYTPPYHSNLQPIEYVWAYVKGIVGRQYTTETTMSDVTARLDLAFADV
ncbi:hypothetical protein DYB32_010369 [Aphanomyces invadans]|uniref:Tc1-like transposase DDE domain-containing protein n=2 Tax=Aphanomyces invadans TaxID=157072 RepID=A0A3R6Y058_9STRA|nr:hypothetical protein DYB32_010369 [Aphanomyces invadans]